MRRAQPASAVNRIGAVKKYSLLCTILLAASTLAGCGKLDRSEVEEFIDKADDTARKRFAPEICALRGEKFRLHLQFESAEGPPTELDLDRKLYCAEAGRFARLRQYKLERKSLEIELAADRRSARVTADYVETMPYYPPDTMPATPDDFYEWQIVESRDESVVGFEGGDLVFLSTDAVATQTLQPKNTLRLPYD